MHICIYLSICSNMREKNSTIVTLNYRDYIWKKLVVFSPSICLPCKGLGWNLQWWRQKSVISLVSWSSPNHYLDCIVNSHFSSKLITHSFTFLDRIYEIDVSRIKMNGSLSSHFQTMVVFFFRICPMIYTVWFEISLQQLAWPPVYHLTFRTMRHHICLR